MAGELDGAKKNLEWAKQHIVNLEAAVREYVDSEPYRFTVDLDWQNRQVIKKVVLNRGVPDNIYFTARDAIAAIRIPLDFLVGELAVINGKTKIGVGFPVAGSAHEFTLAKHQGKIRKLDAAAQAFICGLKPYLGGDNLLWAIHNVNVPDKHRELVPIGMVPAGMSGGFGIGGTGYIKSLTIGMSNWSPLDESMEVMRFAMLPQGAQGLPNFKDNRKPILDVSYREMRTVKYRPIVGFIAEARTRVLEIVNEAERRFFL